MLVTRQLTLPDYWTDTAVKSATNLAVCFVSAANDPFKTTINLRSVRPQAHLGNVRNISKFIYPRGLRSKRQGGGLLVRNAIGRANYSARTDMSLCLNLGGKGTVGSDWAGNSEDVHLAVKNSQLKCSKLN